MSEANLTPEVYTSLPSGDGSEIVTEAGNAHPNGLTRRQFLKLSAAATTSFLGKKFFPIADERRVDKTLSKSEIIQGIEVYGLNEEIKTQDQIDQLYAHFDELFWKKLPAAIKHKDKFEQRDYLLSPNERYLEVVVRRSAYQSFLDRKAETGIDFVEWIKMHIDALNRCMENAKPTSSLKARLLRIVVVDDNFATNPSKYSKDLDATWFIDKDYRVNQKKENIQWYFWSFYHDKEGNLIFRWPPGGDKVEKKYIYPSKNDSLTGKSGIWLDFGLTHEWSHVLLNLPDEYTFDVDLAPFRFKQFFFATGAFVEPWLSPNLSYLLIRNQQRRIRGYYTHPKGIGVMGYREPDQDRAEHPESVRLECFENDKPLEGILGCYTVRYENDEYSKKTFPNSPDQKGENGTLELNPKVFEPTKKDDGNIIYPFNWIFRIGVGNAARELHFPSAAFNMSKIAGKDQANYKINFTSFDDLSKKTQILELVDESDLDKYLKERKKRGDHPYAQMKVDGTLTYFFWSLRD